MKRFYPLNAEVYKDGALPSKTKEWLGLVASMVLRGDEGINSHLIRCQAEGTTDEELEEVRLIELIVGGSFTLPHLRRVVPTNQWRY